MNHPKGILIILVCLILQPGIFAQQTTASQEPGRNRGGTGGEPGDRREVSLLGTGGQTGSFPSLKISNHYEPNESCQTNIRKRSVCPRFPRFPLQNPQGWATQMRFSELMCGHPPARKLQTDDAETSAGTSAAPFRPGRSV